MQIALLFPVADLTCLGSFMSDLSHVHPFSKSLLLYIGFVVFFYCGVVCLFVFLGVCLIRK